MRKDPFNGKLKDPIGFIFALSIVSLSCIILGAILLWEILDGRDNIFFRILAIISLLFAIGHPILFVHVVNNREKYPRLSKVFVKPGYFVDE